MTPGLRNRGSAVALVMAAAGLLNACGVSSHTSALVGTFELTPGQCRSSASAPAGSYLVIGDAADGKPVPAPSAVCADKMFVPLSPAADGGLVTGRFQPDAVPTFGPGGNSLSALIVRPVLFAGVRLGMATSGTDAQNAPSSAPIYPPPTATVTGTRLQIDLRSLHLTYGGPPGATCASAFGQGCWDLGSRSAAGTYDASTHHFTLDWFTGEAFTATGDCMEFHLEGTFVPASEVRS